MTIWNNLSVVSEEEEEEEEEECCDDVKRSGAKVFFVYRGHKLQDNKNKTR